MFNTPTCAQTNRRIQQTVEQGFIPTGQSNRLDVDRQLHKPIDQTIGRYRWTISRTYWSQEVSIDNSRAYWSQK